MRFSRRQLLVVLALALYWPGMFVATHIPQVPRWVGQVPFSDKTLHFVAYLFLVFLLWFAINPYKKVSWRKAVPCWILFAVVWYGVIDEWLQMYVGRNADVWDFVADLAGAVAGLVVLTFFNFWPASLVMWGGGIFLLTNFLRAHPGSPLAAAGEWFYLFGYSFFVMLWLRYIHHFLPVRPPQWKWLLGAVAVPMGLLAGLELYCAFTGCGVDLWVVAIGMAAISGVVGSVLIYGLLCGRAVNAESVPEPAESSY
jgi:VanZ family protein